MATKSRLQQKLFSSDFPPPILLSKSRREPSKHSRHSLAATFSVTLENVQNRRRASYLGGPDSEPRSECRKRCLPASAQLGLRAPSRVIEQTHVGTSHLAVQLRSETVRRNVDHAPAARHRFPDQTLDLQAIGQVMLFDDLRAKLRRRAARRDREERRRTDRAIEVDEQSADGRDYQRCPEGPRHCPRHDQRTGIVPTVGVQKRISFAGLRSIVG